jgi:cell wall-associated NlpC family hydrolase
MPWTDDYIDIPFKPDGRDRNEGLDCWGLVCLVYKERLGIIIPEYKGIYKTQTITSLRRVAKTMREEKDKWQRIMTPEPYDVIMLRTGKFTWHVGVVIDRNNMLHIMHGINSVVESYKGLLWKNRVEEFRHYVR